MENLILLFAGILSGAGIWDFIKTVALNRKNKAETGRIKVETDGLVSTQWKDLVDYIHKEWENAKSTILENSRTIEIQGKQIIKLQQDLLEEKQNCAEDMDILRKQIIKLQTRSNGNH